MTRNNEPEFYVVQLKTPVKGIDDYICVPYTWLAICKLGKKVFVTYPTDEDPSVTRDRVKRKEENNSKWKLYLATIKYKSDTYSDAVQWIATRNNYGPSVEEESKTTDTQQRIPLNKESDTANGNHSSKFIGNSWKPSPRPPIKRPAPLEPQKQLHGKQLKLDNAAQSSSAVVTDANTESKREHLITIQDNQSMECTQKEEAAAASTGNESTVQTTQAQRTEENKQAISLSVKDVNDSPKVIDQLIDEENHSKSIEAENNSSSESHILSNTMAVSKTAEELLTSAERITQPNQYNNQERITVSRSLSLNFQPQIENVRSLANVHNDHDQDSINLKSISRDIKLNSIDLFSQLYSKINEAQRLVSTQKTFEEKNRPMNIKKNLAFTAQNPSNLMDQTASSSARSVEPQIENARSLANVHNDHDQDSINLKSISRDIKLNSIDLFSQLYSKINEAQRLVSTQKTFEEKNRPMNIKKNLAFTAQNPSNLMDQTASSSARSVEPQIENVRSLANVHNDHDQDSINLKSISRDIKLNSIDLFSQLYSKINETQRLVSTQKTFEEKNRPMNIKKNLAFTAQNPSNLMDQTASSSSRSVEEKISVVSQNHSQDGLLVRETHAGNSKDQVGPLGSVAVSFEETQQHVPKINAKPHDVTFVDPRNVFQSATNIATQEKYLLRSHQNPYQPTNRNSFEQDLLRKSKESNNYDNRPNSRTMRIPSTGQNSTNRSNPLHPTSEFPQKKQSQLYQQDIQRQSQIPKGVTKKTPPILKKVPNSLSTIHNKYLLNEQQLQANQKKRPLVNENHLNVMDNVIQIDDGMEEQSPASYAITKDHEVTTDHKKSTGNAPMETTNNFSCNGTTSGSRCVDKPIAPQNSTFLNHQTHPKVVLDPQISDKLTNLYTQMGVTLRNICDIYKTLHSSIRNTVELYKKAMGAVEQLNKSGKVCNASPASNNTKNPTNSLRKTH